MLTVQGCDCRQKPSDESILLLFSCGDGVFPLQFRVRVVQIDILLSQQSQMLLPLLRFRGVL